MQQLMLKLFPKAKITGSLSARAKKAPFMFVRHIQRHNTCGKIQENVTALKGPVASLLDALCFMCFNCMLHS